jgi:hypothetical protein
VQQRCYKASCDEGTSLIPFCILPCRVCKEGRTWIWRVTNKKDIEDTRKMLRDMGKNMTTSEKKLGKTLLENYERTQKMLNEVWNNRDNIQLEDIKKLIFT